MNLHDKIDLLSDKFHKRMEKISDRVLAIEIEFKYIKRLIYIVLSGIFALLLKAFGPFIIKIPPSVTSAAVAIFNNTK